MPAQGNFFLFLSGDTGCAVALEQLKHLLDPEGFEIEQSTAGTGFREVEVEGKAIPLFDPHLLFHGKEGVEKPAALAVVVERGLTVALLIDSIVGIREEPDVERHTLPEKLSLLTRIFDGIIQGEEGLFLLLNIHRIMGVSEPAGEGS
jgi:hypothetical protein